jgi:hypothetical protein
MYAFDGSNLQLSSADGRFGAMMQVNIVNDGPVTFTLESQETSQSSGTSAAPSGTTTPALEQL